MKLFAFYPNGHGEKSFFIMAKNIDIAINQVEQMCKNSKDYTYAYSKDSNYYSIEEYEENEIATNDND